jgi:tetratricopeptide (TPR) repeat protein
MTRLPSLVALSALLLVLASTLSFASAFSPSRQTSGRRLMFGANDGEHPQTSLSMRYERERRDWINQSLTYYRKVMREERRKQLGQLPANEAAPEQQEVFINLANKHYFALRKIKDGRPQHAERIYRKIIDELLQEEDGHCDHAKLAVTTLLLALLLQRLGDYKGTRSVFLSFFRVAILDRDDDKECACSAKVLQAYALFEMKRGNSTKSLEIVKRAVQLDPSLAPVLQWKQFRDALERMKNHSRSRAASSTA